MTETYEQRLERYRRLDTEGREARAWLDEFRDINADALAERVRRDRLHRNGITQAQLDKRLQCEQAEAEQRRLHDEYQQARSQYPELAYALLDRDRLDTLPEPQPLIDGVLDRGTVAILYGKFQTLKSFIAIDWAASVATGRPWQGRETQTAPVLYIAAEGALGIRGRLHAWETGWQRTVPERLHILPHPVNLTNSSEVEQLLALVRWGGYHLVIIDTLARSMVGADENSARDTGRVLDVLHTVKGHTPDGSGVVLAVHHAGKDGKTFRGSSAFESGADTVYFTDGDSGLVVLDRQKRKDGPLDDTHRLRLDLTPGTGSGVIIAASPEAVTERQASAEVVLRIFREHFAHTGATGAQIRDVCAEAAGTPKSTVYAALQALTEAGELANTGSGRRAFYTLPSATGEGA